MLSKCANEKSFQVDTILRGREIAERVWRDVVNWTKEHFASAKSGQRRAGPGHTAAGHRDIRNILRGSKPCTLLTMTSVLADVSLVRHSVLKVGDTYGDDSALEAVQHNAQRGGCLQRSVDHAQRTGSLHNWAPQAYLGSVQLSTKRRAYAARSGERM